MTLQAPGQDWVFELGAQAGLMLDAIRARHGGLVGVYLRPSLVRGAVLTVTMHESAVDDQSAAWAVVEALAPWWPGWLAVYDVALETWTPGTKITTGAEALERVAGGQLARAEWWWAAERQMR